MKHTYKTQGVCPARIEFELNGNIVTNIQFMGGCSGNLRAIQTLLEGETVEKIVSKLSGIACGGRPTSCGDQLSRAVQAAYAEQQ